MNAVLHAVEVLILIALNVAVGILVMKGLLNLIGKLTDEKPALGCVGLPVLMLVLNVSLAAWTIAG